MVFKRDYIGDILVIESDCLQGKIIRPWTGKYNHLAMRKLPNLATSITLTGPERYLLSDPPEEWISFIMLRDKRLNKFDREKIRNLEKKLEKKYDLKLLFNLAFKQINGAEPNGDNISHVGKYNCSSRISRIYEILGYEIINGIHSSQIRPIHFLESKYFEKIKEYKK